MSVQQDAGTSVRSRRTGSRGSSSSSRYRRQRARACRRWLIAGGLLPVLVLLAVWATLDLGTVCRELRNAESAAGQGHRRLLDGDFDAAGESSTRASAVFGDAEAAMRHPMPRLLALIPVARRDIRVVDALSAAGRDVADAGAGALAAISELPGGAAALAPSGGRLPIEHIAALASALQEADERVSRATQRIDDAPARLLVVLVAEARTDSADHFEQILQQVRAGAVLSATLRGSSATRARAATFFGAQNSSELRGTGGLIGAWSVLTVRGGALDFGDFAMIGTLTASDACEVEGPEPGLRGALSALRRAGARAEHQHGAALPLRGACDPEPARAGARRGARRAMVADPYVFEALLSVTGPVDVPDVRHVDADSVVDFLTNEQWAEFPEDAARKPVLGSVAEVALGRFLTDGGDDPATSRQTLARTAGDGHLLLYSGQPADRDAFVAAGVPAPSSKTRRARSLGGDEQRGANKLDCYLGKEWDYEVWLDREGGPSGVRRCAGRTERRPVGGTRLVLGPYVNGAVLGEEVAACPSYAI